MKRFHLASCHDIVLVRARDFYQFQEESLEDRNLLKLRSLDSSCPFFLSDNSIWGQ